MTLAYLFASRPGRSVAMHHLLWDHGTYGENLTRAEFMDMPIPEAMVLWWLHGHEVTDTLANVRSCTNAREVIVPNTLEEEPF